MRIATFNANGIRAACRKGFWDWFDKQNIDVLCIQETKAQLEKLTDFTWPKDYHCFYSDAKKPGYSGVAILCKNKPKEISQSFDYPLVDDEGRLIILHFENFNIACAYFPSGTSGDSRQTLKMEFLDWFKQHIFDPYYKTNIPFILCADVNIAHQKIDLKNWKSNQKSSGFLPEERAFMDLLLTHDWRDTHRHILKDNAEYTWWTYRANARENNVGWRIDYQLIQQNHTSLIKNAKVIKDPIFSDHAPLIVDYDLTF